MDKTLKLACQCLICVNKVVGAYLKTCFDIGIIVSILMLSYITQFSPSVPVSNKLAIKEANFRLFLSFYQTTVPFGGFFFCHPQ